MITIEKRLDLPETYPLSRIGEPRSCSFLTSKQPVCPQTVQNFT